MGLAIVVTLLFLFLSARTAFWVAAGIPVAMSAAIFFMFAFGMTLNMVSLFALIITLGIVVDDAIVVGEHADWRVRHLRETPEQAAVNGAYRMAPPVFASTVTTVIAFAGLLTISGNFGRLIGDIPIVVILVLIASLVECFLILPSHMLHALAGSGGKLRWYDVPSHYVNIGFSWVRETLFRPFIAGVLWARYPVLAGALLLLALQGASFVRGDVQWRFWNSPEQGSVSGNFAMLPGATRSDTMEMMREMQRAADAVAARLEAEHGTNPLAYVVAEVGGNTGRVLAGSETKDENQLGSISIELIDADLRPYSSFEFVAQLQEEVRNHPMVEEVSFRGWRGGPGGDALAVRFSGVDADTLKSASEALKTALSAFPEVSAVEDNMAYDKEELVLDLTPRGEALGFSIDAVGRILRERLGGIEAANFPDGPRTATIRVELPPGELTADFLERTQMRSVTGQYVPLADIVSVERVAGFSSVRREDGMRLISVTGDIASDDPERANEIGLALRQTILPQIEEDFGVAWELSGLAEDERSFLGDAAVGFGLCLLGIYLALAWIFSSWGRPFVVMAVIPFGLVGAIWGHAVWDVPISMFSVVGLIGMAGIIVNDSIVLVSTVDEYRHKRGLIPAIIDGACDRLRPVFLTTLTTVLGLAPLLFERSQDAQFLRPTVITIVYGLGFGMVLVLLVVPALLAIGQDFANQGRSLRRAVASRSRDRGLGVVALVGAAGVLALFAATIGAQVWTGVLPAVFGGLAGAGFGGAVVAFLGAVAVFLVALAAVAAALLGRRRAA
jgi:multidrug efflux pump subunit AcrB